MQFPLLLMWPARPRMLRLPHGFYQSLSAARRDVQYSARIRKEPPSRQGDNMDVNLAIKFAQLVNAAYALDPKNTGSLAGQPITAGGMGYTIVTTVFANDLATEIMPGRSRHHCAHRTGAAKNRRRRYRHRDSRHGRRIRMGTRRALLDGAVPLSRGRRQHRGWLHGHVRLAAHGQRSRVRRRWSARCRGSPFRNPCPPPPRSPFAAIAWEAAW